MLYRHGEATKAEASTFRTLLLTAHASKRAVADARLSGSDEWHCIAMMSQIYGEGSGAVFRG